MTRIFFFWLGWCAALVGTYFFTPAVCFFFGACFAFILKISFLHWDDSRTAQYFVAGSRKGSGFQGVRRLKHPQYPPMNCYASPWVVRSQEAVDFGPNPSDCWLCSASAQMDSSRSGPGGMLGNITDQDFYWFCRKLFGKQRKA